MLTFIKKTNLSDESLDLDKSFDYTVCFTSLAQLNLVTFCNGGFGFGLNPLFASTPAALKIDNRY